MCGEPELQLFRVLMKKDGFMECQQRLQSGVLLLNMWYMASNVSILGAHQKYRPTGSKITVLQDC